MRGKLPIYIENRELPVDKYKVNKREYSYGYVNLMYLISLIITGASLLTVMIVGMGN